jgi:MFS family permease
VSRNGAASKTPFEHAFPANVILVVLTLFPGLINTSAVNFAATSVARDLHALPSHVSVLVLLNDATLAFGCLLAAELTRRVPNRSLYMTMLIVSAVTSLLSCVAPNLAIFGAAHCLHGLVGGMLFVIALPPLFLNFASTNIRGLVSVLVPSLFGAATLGPIVASGLQEPNAWRIIFACEIVLALVALLLARKTVAYKQPPPTTDPVDWESLVLAAIGTISICIGAGELARNGWQTPGAFIPAAIGIAAFAAIFIWEAIDAKPLVPVRRLVRSVAIVGSISTIAGSAIYSATQTTMTLELERLLNLTPTQTGLSYIPAAVAALISGFLYARLVTTRWVTIVGAIGIAVSLAAVCIGLFIHDLNYAGIEGTLFIAAIGAGLSVTPGIFMIGLSFERALVTRAIALLNMLRLTGGFISVPGIQHSIGSRAADNLQAALPPMSHEAADRAAREFLINGQNVANLPAHVLHEAVRSGIVYGLGIAAAICLVSLTIIAVLFAERRIRLVAPVVSRIAEGKPALEAG